MLALSLAPLLLSSLGTAPQEVESTPRAEGKSIEVRSHFVVGTTAPRAIRAGVDVLERGGTAVDAALTTALLQTTLCAGCWVSFAGRLTAVVYDAQSGEVVALNACYDAPRGEDDPLSIPRQPTPSGRTVLVPGFMAGVEALRARFGALEFAELFEPSIRLAEEGFVLDANLARLIRGKASVLLRTEAGRAVFTDEAGALVEAGATFRQPELAATLRGTATEGAAHMYEGAWAERFVAAVQAEGGKLALEDLVAYAPTWQTPIRARFGDTVVHGLPAPNRGGPSTTLALRLGVLAGLESGGDPVASAVGLRRLAEIERALGVLWRGRGRAALRELVPGAAVLWEDTFANEDGARALWEGIESEDWGQVVRRTWGPLPADDHSDAIVAVDAAGNVVALIHTINTAGWGTTGLFVGGVSIPDSAASQQAAMARVGPGGRMPDHGVPLIGTRDGVPVFASSATGSGNVQASWQNALRLLAGDLGPSAVADGPNLYAGEVQRGDFSDETVQAVRAAGFPLGVTERFSGSTRGYWVGARMDPDAGTMHAACLTPLSGVAVGR